MNTNMYNLVDLLPFSTKQSVLNLIRWPFKLIFVKKKK